MLLTDRIHRTPTDHALVLTALAVLTAGMLLAGCADTDRSTVPDHGDHSTLDATEAKSDAAGDTINGYVVTFLGREAVAGETTFSWRVHGTGVHPALSHFTVELPECAPGVESYEPTGSVSINRNPQTGIFGLEWHLQVDPDDSVGRTYSITFADDVPTGEVRGAVKAGDETVVGEIAGPCDGFEIAGRIFVDADEDGLRDPDEESGIPDVIVELVRSDGRVYEATTDLLGRYSFRRSAGDYTVRVRSVTGVDAFNAQLAESFEATGPTSREVTVPPETAGVDFGFSPLEDELILDLETGVLLSDGLSVKFWRSELRSALRGGGGQPVHDPATVAGFLAAVQELYLPDPFTFTPGAEIAEAFDVLSGNPRTELETLRQELLALELNEVSGHGLVGRDDLQLVLIAWGEALVADALAAAKARDGSDGGTVLGKAAELFQLVNDTGGGGAVDE